MKKIIFSIMLAIFVVAGVALSDYFPDVIVTSPDGIWTDARAYSTLEDALAAVGSEYREVRITREETFTDLIIPSTVSLKFSLRGALNNSGQLTINTTDIDAPNRNILTGSGEMDFARGSVLKSEWFNDLHAAFDQTVDNYITLVMTGGWGDNVDADCQVGDNVGLRWDGPGNRVVVNSGVTLSNIKNIDAGDYQIWGGSGDLDFLDGTELRLNWFNRLRSVLTWIEDEEVSLVVSNNHIVDYDATIVDNVEVKFLNGSLIDGNGVSGVTFEAGPFQIDALSGQQIFGDSITVSFSKSGIITPDMFGAIGDDSTDCTSAFTRAIASLTSGGEIELPGEVYRISSLDLSNNTVGIKFLGKTGVQITAIRVTNSTGTIFDLTEARFVEFHNINFSPTSTESTNGALFMLDGSADCVFKDLRIGTFYDCFYFEDTSSTPSNNVFDGCDFIDYGTHTWNWIFNFADDVASHKIRNCTLQTSRVMTGGFLTIASGAGVDTLIVENVSAQKQASGAIPIGFDIQNGEFIFLDGCRAETGLTSGTAFKISDGTNIELTKPHASTSLIGIDIDGGDGIKIIGGHTYYCNNDGIDIDGGSNITIGNHDVFDVSRAGANTYDGINIAAAVGNVKVVGGNIDSIRGDTVTMRYGIYVADGGSDPRIIKNNIINPDIQGTGAIYHTFSNADDQEDQLIVRDNTNHDRNLMQGHTRTRTTDATETTLWSYTLNDNEHLFLRATVLYQASGGTPTGAYVLEYCVYRDGGAAVEVSGVTTQFSAEHNAAMDCTMDVDTNDVRVRGTGMAGNTFDWSVNVEILGKISSG